jgi:hypothetical protein
VRYGMALEPRGHQNSCVGGITSASPRLAAQEKIMAITPEVLDELLKKCKTPDDTLGSNGLL